MAKNTKTVTFKVHKAERSINQCKVTLHQLDPLEHIDPALKAVNELTGDHEAPHSGDAKVQVLVTDVSALDFFVPGHYVDVTFTPRTK